MFKTIDQEKPTGFTEMSMSVNFTPQLPGLVNERIQKRTGKIHHSQ
jgi:hypothetical protein